MVFITHYKDTKVSDSGDVVELRHKKIIKGIVT